MEPPVQPPNLIRQQAFDVVGFAARTTNAREADPQSAEVPRLWQRFFDENVTRHVHDAIPGRVATVYHDYEADENGEFTVVLGPVTVDGPAVPEGMTRTRVPAGDYLEFVVDGMPPTAIRDAWVRIHDWFAVRSSPRRAFNFDFELLVPGRTTICISVTDADGHAG